MRIVALTVLTLGLATAAQVSAQAPAAPAASTADVNQTLVSVEIEGSKFWLPGTVVAKQGQTVRLTLINKVQSDPDQHGFSIPAFNVAEVVKRGETKTVTFKADKAGVFPMVCQLHPAHVGGQLVVLP